MKKITAYIIFWLAISFLLRGSAIALIAPVEMNGDSAVTLVSSDKISLSFEKLELYHHPLGIWLATYRATLLNNTAHPVTQTIAFPAGFDERMVDKDLVCDAFQNFKVFADGEPIKKIQSLLKCTNFVKTTGIEWTMDDGSGVGFVNVFALNFSPEEKKTVHITFNFIVKKPPIKFNPKNKQSWYTESMDWLKQDYELRPENDFKLPVSLASFWALYPDSIVFETYLAKNWLSIVPRDKRAPERLVRKKYEFTEPFGFYTPPDVELEPLTETEIATMSKTKRWLLKNAFPAKYGKIFSHPLLKLYFSKQPWYKPDENFHVWYLTEWDSENIKLLYGFGKKGN
ncbi:MAG: YARHG domain-containing protein [Calditrichaeota bacterium]|nr:YARHG domain-containing protein [Calditrichota bacterium]